MFFQKNDFERDVTSQILSEKLLEKYSKQEGTFTVYAFRRDEFIQFEVQGGAIDLTTVELKVEDQAKAEKWLKA